MDISSVRGIGVADMVSTSTLAFSALMCSLCSTPKRCSSSTTMRPKFFQWTPVCSRRCVPTTMSIEPSASPLKISVASFFEVKRDRTAILTGKPAMRSLKVS